MNVLLEGGRRKLLPQLGAQTLVRTGTGVKAGAGWGPGNCWIPWAQHRHVHGGSCAEALQASEEGTLRWRKSLFLQGSKAGQCRARATPLSAQQPGRRTRELLPGLGTRRPRNLPSEAADQTQQEPRPPLLVLCGRFALRGEPFPASPPCEDRDGASWLCVEGSVAALPRGFPTAPRSQLSPARCWPPRERGPRGRSPSAGSLLCGTRSGKGCSQPLSPLIPRQIRRAGNVTALNQPARCRAAARPLCPGGCAKSSSFFLDD